ncbi:amidohydrolase family protein [Rhizorhabdus dicambivorans]|uniref:Amidohydrolase n=1 Tax=Rhizorhabdus dicambivorans TaxID=1850238 RepID=A0A2A4G2I3_9SPHN|nr:amidohydrolase family protein [Rhizorhabdus dicambivorans]ATE66521.1 amidohydrolase [Rhizorhabdus dicambivorans]PCE43997.1 amidohydrolase [Rhizorhabdus dicambivorans]
MTGDWRIISSDSHVVEHCDLWQTRVAQKYRDRAPRLVSEADTDRLVCEDVAMPPIGFMAGAYRSNKDVKREGRWETDVPSIGYDPDARLKAIDADGVYGEVLFPTLGLIFFTLDDLDFKWALFRAYNDWIAEFCKAHPNRYKGIALVAHDDVELAAQEIRRVHKLGLSGFMLATVQGEAYQPYSSKHYYPMWQAAVECNMPAHFHSATSRDKRNSFNNAKGRDPIWSLLRVDRIQRPLLGMLMGGTFDAFPDLLFVSAENEVSWAPLMLESADFEFHRHRGIEYQGFDTRSDHPPSYYWQRNVKAAFMRDHVVARFHDMIGTETLMFQTDFPHSVSTFPNTQAFVQKLLAGVDPVARDKMLYQNAADLYGF